MSSFSCSLSSSGGEPLSSMDRSSPASSSSPHTIHASDVEKELGIFRIFQEISSKYKLQMSAFCNNQLVQLTNPDNDLSTRVIGYSFDLNPAATQECCRNKAAVYHLLREARIPVIESEIFFDQNAQTMELIYSYAEQHNNSVLCTPVGALNENEAIRIESREELDTTIQNLFQHCLLLYISPYYPIACEYRVITLNASAEFVVKTIPPQTALDEESTEIMTFKRVSPRSPGSRSPDPRSPNSSPLGFAPQDFEINQVISLAQAAAKALRIAFCSINIAQIATGELKIKNVNPEVTIEQFIPQNSKTGYQTAKSVYEKVICQLLEKAVIPEPNAIHPLMGGALLSRIFDPPPSLDLASS